MSKTNNQIGIEKWKCMPKSDDNLICYALNRSKNGGKVKISMYFRIPFIWKLKRKGIRIKIVQNKFLTATVWI